MYKRIAVAVGDYPEIDPAVASAIALAAHTDAELLLLRVLTAPLTFGAPDMVTCSHLATRQRHRSAGLCARLRCGRGRRGWGRVHGAVAVGGYSRHARADC